MKSSDAEEVSAEGDRSRVPDSKLGHIQAVDELLGRHAAQFIQCGGMILFLHQPYQGLMRRMLQRFAYRADVGDLAPGIASHGLPHQFYLSVHQCGMFASDQVMPFPRLAAEEGESSHDGPGEPFHNAPTVSIMSRMHGQ